MASQMQCCKGLLISQEVECVQKQSSQQCLRKWEILLQSACRAEQRWMNIAYLLTLGTNRGYGYLACHYTETILVGRRGHIVKYKNWGAEWVSERGSEGCPKGRSPEGHPEQTNKRGSEVFILLRICPSDPSNIVIIITRRLTLHLVLLPGM